MKKNDYLRIRRQWRANRDRVMAEILKQAPSLTLDEARTLADKHMGYSPRPKKKAANGK